MKKLRLLWKVIRRLNFDRILYGFIGWYAVASVLILIVEPGITRLGDAFWYMFVACTSIGFGDVISITFIGRLLTVITTIYEIVIVAMFSGVVVSYYLEVVHRRENETIAMYLDKLEHATELSPEELREIQDKVKTLR